MSRHTKARGDAQVKEIRAWGIRRREVDINQLALAYYLLARRRIEAQRQSDVPNIDRDGAATLPPGSANQRGPRPKQTPEAA
jgi:hypothetical protein